MSETLIKVENVSKKFCKSIKHSMLYGMESLAKTFIGSKNTNDKLKAHEFWAEKDVSFELKRGECLGLLGPNGSGKSTLLKLLNGIISPDMGRITINGNIGALIEVGAGFHPMLSGRENIYINGSILGFTKKEIDKKFDEIVEFAEIKDFIDTPVKHYSSGMHVRLGFAIAAQMKPDVLLIDEILAVGDIGFRIKCLNAMSDIIKNSAVVFVTHSMPFVSKICTDVMILEDGMIVHQSKNINEGIDRYLSRFNTSQKRVSGSGKASVSKIQLSGIKKSQFNDKGLLLLDYGDDLIIKMSVTMSPLIKKPIIRCIIWNQEQIPVADSFTEIAGANTHVEKTSNITVKLPNLYLNMGVYTIAITVMDKNSDEVCIRLDGASKFQMKFAHTSWAHFVLPGEWKESIVSED